MAIHDETSRRQDPGSPQGRPTADAPTARTRIGGVLARLSPDGWAIVAITVAVLVANLPYLLGVFDPNLLDSRIGLTSALTPGLLDGRPTIDPNLGFSSQALGHLAALDLLHLRLPWWNPYEATGMPLTGETQAAALFPPTLLTALSGGQVPERILLELIAGICALRLLRRLEITRPAAVAGAVAFALNGTFAWFGHAAINPVAFLPMLVLGIERAYAATQADRRGGWRLLALAGALSVYAGFPETAYLDALVAVGWMIWRAGCLDRGRRAAFTAKAALGGAAGTLLALPMLVAMSNFLGHADVGVHTNGQLASEHLPGGALPQLLLPYIYGQINGDPRAVLWTMVGGYLSVSLLLFATVGTLGRRLRGLRLLVFIGGLLVLARMYGEPPLLGHVIGALPGMSKVAVFRYGTPALELFTIVLAALGLDDLARASAGRRRLLVSVVAAGGLLAAAVLAARPIVDAFGPGSHHRPYLIASVVAAILILGAVGAGALLLSARPRAILFALLVGIEAVTLFAVPEFSAPRAATPDLAPVAYLRRHLGEGRFFTLGPIQPNYGSYFALATLNVNDFIPKGYSAYVHARLDPTVNPRLFVGDNGGWRPLGAPSPTAELTRHLAAYRNAAVRYILTPAGQPLRASPRDFSLVKRTPTTWVYRVNAATDYFTAAGCRVNSPARESARTVCRSRATLVRRETAFPGWSARVDGHPVAIARVDGLFQSVRVPAGAHRITFAFAPPRIGWAALGLLGGCVLMSAPGLGRRRRLRRPRDGDARGAFGPGG